MRLPKPKRADISLEEALTILAWGVPFTPDDFARVLEVGENRVDSHALEKKLYDLKATRTSLEAEHSQHKLEYDRTHPELSQPDIEESTEASLSYLNSIFAAQRDASEASKIRVDIEHIKAEMFFYGNCLEAARRADLVVNQIEIAAGTLAFGCDEFWQTLEDAGIHLWNAIKTARVTAMGMPDLDALDWQLIPATWFNHDPQPYCEFGRNTIYRSEVVPGLIPRWHRLRFDRSQIEGLRSELLKVASLPLASDSPISFGDAIPAGTSANSPNQDERIMLVLREIRPGNPGARPTEKECVAALERAGLSMPRRVLRGYMNKLDLPAKSGPRPSGS